MRRFTDTDKWTMKWFRALKPTEKLLWLWIHDACDNGGFWDIDFELAAVYTSIPTGELEGALKGLARGYVRQGNVLWVKGFLDSQKNMPLNPDNNAHKQIMRIFAARESSGFDINQCVGIGHDTSEESRGLQGSNQGLISPIGKGKGIGNGKEEGVQGGKQFTLTEVQNAAYLAGVDDEHSLVFFNHYNAQGWRRANHLPVTNLPSLLALWKQNQYRFADKTPTKKTAAELDAEYEAKDAERRSTQIH